MLNKRSAFYLILAVLLFWGGTPASPAERIVLRYSGSILEASVSVGELTELAETGIPSPELKFYLDRLNQDPNNLRTALVTEVPVSGVRLSQALYHPVGEFLLDQMGEVIQTPARQANRQALRAAMVNSALNDNKITLLEVLKNYPTQEILINGDRLTQIVQQLQQLSQAMGF
jgi:hypothetical protein